MEWSRSREHRSQAHGCYSPSSTCLIGCTDRTPCNDRTVRIHVYTCVYTPLTQVLADALTYVRTSQLELPGGVVEEAYHLNPPLTQTSPKPKPLTLTQTQTLNPNPNPRLTARVAWR